LVEQASRDLLSANRLDHDRPIRQIANRASHAAIQFGRIHERGIIRAHEIAHRDLDHTLKSHLGLHRI
jgi:hypothetical protein